MKLLRSLCTAFSMYSRLPVPRTRWEESNLEYALCFFPLVGAVMGGLLLLLSLGMRALSLPAVLRGALLLVFALFITGGIHMDGFLDTADALSSHAPREKKLEILKDSHTGAFAIIVGGAYLMLITALLSCVPDTLNEMLVYALIPACSRAASGLFCMTMPNARNSGMLFTFTDAAKKRAVLLSLIVWAAVLAIAAVLLSPAAGAALVLSYALSALWFFRMAKTQFGGITGDLAGCFTAVSEAAALLLLTVFSYAMPLL